MGEEGGGGGVDERPPRRLAPAGRPHPARLHQHVERALRDLDSADRLDLGAADRLVIGDDRQRLDRGARQPPGLVALAPEDEGEVGRGLEMPAPAALDQLDPAPVIMAGKLGQRGGDVDLGPTWAAISSALIGSSAANSTASTARRLSSDPDHHAALM